MGHPSNGYIPAIFVSEFFLRLIINNAFRQFSMTLFLFAARN